MDPTTEIMRLKERVGRVADWIWEVDLDGVVRYSSHSVREAIGYTPRGIVGKSIFNLIAEADAETLRSLVRRGIDEARPIRDVTIRFRAKDSTIRSFEVSCVPVLDNSGKMTGFRGVSKDITERVVTEHLAEQVVRNSQTGLFIVQNSVVLFVNPRICELMEYSSEEVLGTNIWKYVHPEDAAWLSGYLSRRLAGEKVPARYVARGITKSGELRHYEIRAAVIEYEDAPAMLLNAVDITDSILAREALANSERDFRELVEKTSDWVWQVDENFVYTYASPRAREMFGYNPEEIVGKTPFDLMLSDEAKRVKEILKPIIKARKSVTMLENTMLHRDGHLVLVETNAEPVFDDDKAFAGYRGIDRDVTDRKRTEDQLHKAVSEMETVLHAFPDVYFWLDAEGAILDYHAADPTELYLPPESFLGKNMQEVLPEDVGKQFADAITKVIKTSSMVSIEYLLELPQGPRQYEARLMPLPDNQAIAIIRNITERTQAEEQLADERNFTAAVLKTAASLVIVMDRQGRIVMFNRACETAMGYSLDELKGKPIWDILLLPEEAQEVKAIFDELKVTALPTRHENHWIARDGSRRLIAWSDSVMLGDSGEVEYVIGTGIDITDAMRAEKELGESREMLQLVIKNIPQYVFWKDINSVYLGCNDNFAAVAGVGSPEKIVRKTDYDLAWTKEESDSYREWDRRVMDEDKPALHILESQLTADGKSVWLDTNKIPLHDAEGQVVGILGTYEDITERKAAEQALQEAEAKYRGLVEETMVGVYMIQGDRFVYVNPRMLEIFGTTSEEMMGQSPLEFVAPEDRALVADNLRKRLSEGVKSIRYAFKALRKDGTPIDVEVHGAVTSYMGKPAVIGSLIDITERKRYVEALQDSEERYRQLFEHSPDMVLLLSAANSTFIAMNPAVTQALGYAPYDVLGKSPWDISPEYQPDGKLSKDEAKRLLAGQSGSPAQRFEWVYKHKDGTLVDCEISLVSYRFHGEDLIQAIIRDITERKRAEESRRKLEKDLDRQKRVFYRETILSVTSGKLDICDYADVEPYITRATSSVEVEDASQVGPARHQAQSLVHEHGLTGERLDCFMVGVGEAITNAIKHGVHGTVRIGEDDTAIWVVVSDKGVGIESLILPRAVLLRGFSTKPSLGLGYSIMLDVCDRILLSTGDQGTNVVLIKDKAEHNLTISPELLPDTWDNIPS